MNVNITHAGVKAHANGHVSVSFSTAEYDQKRATKGMGSYPEHIVYLTLQEVRHAICCLSGDALFSPFFNDGIHMILFGTNGARIRNLDGGVSRRIYKSPTDEGPAEYEQGYFCRESYLSFPGREFAFFLELAYKQAARFKTDKDDAELESKSPRRWLPPEESRRNYDRLHYIRNRTWKHNIQTETIAKWKKDYSPNISMIFERDADKHYMAALHDPRVPNVDPKKRSTLKDQVQSLARIARNYSDGDLVRVYICPDHAPSENPMSFYWNIQKHGRKVSNGGIIAHANHAKTESGEYEQDGTFEYSIHT